MKVVFNFFMVVLIACIPLLSLLTAFNVVLRMPDLYAYEFNSAQIAQEIQLGIEDDELGDFFSDFMLHKNDEFDLTAEYQDREQSVFESNEQKNMENIRSLLNISLIGIVGMLAYMIVVYCFLLFKKKKDTLRYTFKGGFYVFLFLIILMIIVYNTQYVREMLYQFVFIAPFNEENVLPLLLTNRFFRDFLIASGVAAFIILMILTSITWRVTKPRRMFGKYY